LRLGVVVNPTAGKGWARAVGGDVVETLAGDGHDVLDLSGRNADLALEHAHRAVADGLDALVVIGGDGMVHLGVQATAATGTPLGIVAVGTGNDFAAVVGLPVRDASAGRSALRIALEAGTMRSVDAIEVTGPGVRRPHGDAPHARWCAGAVSAGLDAAVNARANAMLRPRGSSRYTLAALAEIAAFRAWSYTLELEGVVDDGGLVLEPLPDGRRTWTGRAAMVTAANTPQIGGGIRVTPDASPTDGLLDLLVATVRTRAAAAAIFPTMFSGRHVARRDVHVARARAVTIRPGPSAGSDGEPPLPAAHADGEHLGTLPLRAAVRPGALRLLAPPVGWTP
jgi:diacylglycerol kinase (ATP)